MNRYIDVDALIEAIGSTGWYHINREGKLVSGAGTDLNPLYKAEDILKVVIDAPSADVVERKRGEWIEGSAYKTIIGAPEGKTREIRAIKCSNCEAEFGTVILKWGRFCPNCGADMREEE